MIDVLLSQAGDGLDITVEGGLVALTSGPQSAIILSMFGGNIADAGNESTKHLQYWGNLDESDELRTYRGETLHLLNRLPMTSGNLGTILDAANRDLAWLLDGGYVSDLTVSARIVGARRVAFTITTPEGSLKVTAPWLG